MIWIIFISITQRCIILILNWNLVSLFKGYAVLSLESLTFLPCFWILFLNLSNSSFSVFLLNNILLLLRYSLVNHPMVLLLFSKVNFVFVWLLLLLLFLYYHWMNSAILVNEKTLQAISNFILILKIVKIFLYLSTDEFAPFWKIMLKIC